MPIIFPLESSKGPPLPNVNSIWEKYFGCIIFCLLHDSFVQERMNTYVIGSLLIQCFSITLDFYLSFQVKSSLYFRYLYDYGPYIILKWMSLYFSRKCQIHFCDQISRNDDDFPASEHCIAVGSNVARTLLSWNRIVSETCPTRMSCIFLRICHVSTCRVHFNVVMSVLHRLVE